MKKNTLSAFTRAFDNGFGVETDLRDYNGTLVISHDVPQEESLLFEDFLKIIFFI